MSTGIPTTIVFTATTMIAAMDPTLVANGAVIVIAALGFWIIQIINARSAAKDRSDAAAREQLAAAERKALFEQGQQAAKLADDIAKKSNVLVTTTAEIKELSNSTNSNLQTALKIAGEKAEGVEKLTNEKVRGLEAMIAQLIEEKRTTAATRAMTDAQQSVSVRTTPTEGEKVTGSQSEESLSKIEDHTAATAKNTAKTDATVQELKDQK